MLKNTCLYASIAESIIDLLVGMHQNLRRVYQNPSQRNLPAYRKHWWVEFYKRLFYEVNIKKTIYEIEHQDIYLDKMIYEHPNEVKIKNMAIYMHTKIYNNNSKS